MRKPFLLIAAVVAIGIVLSIFSLAMGLQKAPMPSPPNSALPIEGTITISGQIACLPKRTTGPQTLECALGLKAVDNTYYALRNLFENDPDYMLAQTDTRVEVTGALTQEEMHGPDGNPYDIVGVIAIDSISKL